MCRIAGVARINDENRKDVWKFMKLLGKYMTRGNNDGLGYAAFDKNGKIFGERWLNNSTAFTDLSQIKGMNSHIASKVYSSIGDEVKRDEAQAIILHTRFATCEKGIKNTHPFVNDEDSPTSVIIHNGVIANHEELLKKYSTCDSEVIVHLYEQLKVVDNIQKLQDVMDQLQGWFTVLGLSTQKDGRLIMDAFTDMPRLASAFIPQLQTRIYSTAGYDIASTAKDLGFTCIDPKSIYPNSGFRVDVVTGELIEYYEYQQESITQETEAALARWFTSRQ